MNFIIHLQKQNLTEVKHISSEVLNKTKDKLINLNIFRIHSDESIMCEFYCIVFIEYIIAGKTLLDYTNLFSLNDYQKNDKVTYKYFKDKCDKRKYGRRL